MRSIVGVLLSLVILSTFAARAQDLSSISNQEASSGLKDALTQRFLPIVTAWTSKVGLAEQYNNLIDRGVQLGLVRKDERIENYVTRKALDGLYLVIAEQERALRQDPLGAASNVAKKVFGLLR